MGKYYDHQKMEPLELQLKQILMSWPKMQSKNMFGCPAFLADDKLFCFLVTDGIVLTKLTENLGRDIRTNLDWTTFEPDGRSVKSWLKISLVSHRFTEVLPYIQQVYHHTMNTD